MNTLKVNNLSLTKRVKWAIIGLSIFIASIAAQLVAIAALFIGEMLSFSNLPKISAVLLFAVEIIIMIFVGILTYKKAFHYLKNVFQARISGNL